MHRPHSPCPHLQRLVVQQHPLARVEAEEALRRHPAPRLAPDALRERTPVHGVAEERVVGHLAQAVGTAAEATRRVGLQQSLAEVPRSRGEGRGGGVWGVARECRRVVVVGGTPDNAGESEAGRQEAACGMTATQGAHADAPERAAAG